MVEYRGSAPGYALGGGGPTRSNLADLDYNEFMSFQDHTNTLHTNGVTWHRLPFGTEPSRKVPV